MQRSGRTSRSARGRRLNRRGFSLLEVMLAMLLSAILLAVLSTALSLHLRAFDSGRLEIERSQLARAIFRKIETDLHRTVGELPSGPSSPGSPPATPSNTASANSTPTGTTPPNTAPPTTPSGATAANDTTVPPASGQTPLLDGAQSPMSQTAAADAPPIQPGTLAPTQDDSASLIGDAHQLRLRVCQVGLGPDATQVTANLDDRRIRLPDDLKTIYYWLAEPSAENQIPGAEGMPSGSAFVRREGPWLRWRDLAQVDQLFRIGEATPEQGPDDTAQFFRSERPWQEPGTIDDALVIAGEVNGLRFRYFDGAFWRTQWNSTRERALPAAVEISLMLRDDERHEAEAPSPTGDIPFQPTYRLVVQLAARPSLPPKNPSAAPGAIDPAQIPIVLP